METVTVRMELPRDVLLAADISEANAPVDIKRHLALYMFKERKLSFGKAAELSGMDKLGFFELAGSNGISLNYDEDDFQEDLSALKELAI